MLDSKTISNLTSLRPSKTLVALLLFAIPLVLTGNRAVAQSGAAENVSFDQVLAFTQRDHDARIAYGNDEHQYGLLWLPEGQARPPLFVFIHGGCWLNSFDVEHSRALATALADEGFAVWSLEYRRTGDNGGGWPGTFEDIRLALASRNKLEEFGIDSNRFAIGGHSAGGHLALLAGEYFSSAEAVFGLAAIADIESYAQGDSSCERATIQFMNSTAAANPEAYVAANPARRELHANTHVLHGDMDAIVPLQQAQSLQAPLHLVQGAGHFDWIHPDTPAFAELLGVLKQSLELSAD